MTTAHGVITGWYYDGSKPVAIDASLEIGLQKATLRYGEERREYAINTLHVSPRTGQADRFIEFEDGGQYQCNDSAQLDKLPQTFATESIVSWLEQHTYMAIISIILVIAFMFGGYRYGLPQAAGIIVDKIPIETDIAIGNKAIKWLDSNNFLQRSEVDIDTQITILNRFEELHQDLSISPNIILHFRKSTHVGANAIALPGGAIIITDELIELADSNEEILAVLAHESGHVENRHSMQNILQSSLATLVVSTFTADVNFAGTAFAGIPVTLMQATYSRKLETEADDFAVELLKEHNISSSYLADMLVKLEEQHGNSNEAAFSLMSTHPVTSERVKRIRGE